MPSVKAPVPQPRLRKGRLRGEVYEFRELPGQAYRDVIAAQTVKRDDGSSVLNEDAFYTALVAASLFKPTLSAEAINSLPNGLRESLHTQAIQTNVVREQDAKYVQTEERLYPDAPLSRVLTAVARGCTYRMVEISAEDYDSLQQKFTHPNQFGVEVIDQEPFQTALLAKCLDEPRMPVPALLALPNALLMTLVDKCRELNRELDEFKPEDFEEVASEDESPSPGA